MLTSKGFIIIVNVVLNLANLISYLGGCNLCGVGVSVRVFDTHKSIVICSNLAVSEWIVLEYLFPGYKLVNVVVGLQAVGMIGIEIRS